MSNKKTHNENANHNDNAPKKTARKRRNKDKKPILDTVKENTILSKDQLKQKLKDKLKLKQTARLSRYSREIMIEKLEDKVVNATGKEKLALKKQIKNLEDIEDKELSNENGRTIPDYD